VALPAGLRRPQDADDLLGRMMRLLQDGFLALSENHLIRYGLVQRDSITVICPLFPPQSIYSKLFHNDMNTSRRKANSRPPLERMMRLHQMMQNNEYPNCPKLAKEFEISIRTLKRDAEFMKTRFNLPIEYDAKKYGYYYSEPVSHFPNLSLTEQELFALLVAHKAIEQYRSTELQKPLEDAFKKITGHLDHSRKFSLGGLGEALSIRPFAPDDTDLKVFRNLTLALKENRTIKFQYKKLGAKKPQPRHVHPYHLACIENHWYLFGYDVDRKAIRTFVLARLTDLRLRRQRFSREKAFKLDEYLQGSFLVFKGSADKTYDVVIDFDEWATDFISGRKWQGNAETSHHRHGGSRRKFQLNSLGEIERWVLSLGRHVKVLGPQELCQRLHQTGEFLVKNYGQKSKAATGMDDVFCTQPTLVTMFDTGHK